MPWGLVLGLPSMNTASVSSNRIAHRPCACAPDAFRSGCGRVSSAPLGRLLGSQEVPLRSRGPSLGLAACVTVCLTSRVPRDVIEPRSLSTRGIGAHFLRSPDYSLRDQDEEVGAHVAANDSTAISVHLRRTAGPRDRGSGGQADVPDVGADAQVGRPSQDVAPATLRHIEPVWQRGLPVHQGRVRGRIPQRCGRNASSASRQRDGAVSFHRPSYRSSTCG